MDFFQQIKQKIQFDFSYIVKETNALFEFDHEFWRRMVVVVNEMTASQDISHYTSQINGNGKDIS